MDTILSIHCDELSEERLHNLTSEFVRTLGSETDIIAKTVTSHGKPGGKGVDPVTVGQIALAALGSGGAVVALVNVLKSYECNQNCAIWSL